ncbi:putative serpin-like protein [Neochlamydia sp. TUME1]|uniref:serpin family protein n=1 Tax=Neochlamydia sp. TUME1 TaxID=1478174 RepID=UPI00057ED507|nr:serpin family protein [Neochlamydia sp. TUME1]KIC74915.1 putative serpin-like protein [Neochlamydia sp. TUME1]
MKHIFTKTWFKLVVLGWISLFSLPIQSEEEKTSHDELNERLLVSQGANAFAVDMYNQLPSTNNLCFSPYSIFSSFAMAYTGADENTHKEISAALHYPPSVDKLGKGLAELNHFFTFYPSSASDEIRVRVANSLWIQTNFPLLPSYKENMKKYFNGTFRVIDFKGQPETARATINAWVKHHTFGKIIDILHSQAIDSSTRMVLVSALYLKAKWKNPFDPHLTTQQPFFTEDGVVQTALSMTQTAYLPYLDTPEATVVELPYILSRKEGPEFSMMIILPHQKEALREVEKGLTVRKLEEWRKNLENTKVLITIPKFKVLQSSNLKDILEKMGMHTPFSEQANFSKISEFKGLKIGNVLHKVYLSMDENGSEVAAATSISMNVTSILEPKAPVIFQVDHPFIYMIYEKKTGTILFMGRVTDPNKS